MFGVGPEDPRLTTDDYNQPVMQLWAVLEYRFGTKTTPKHVLQLKHWHYRLQLLKQSCCLTNWVLHAAPGSFLPQLLCLKEPLEIFLALARDWVTQDQWQGMVTVTWGWKQYFTQHSLSLKCWCVEIQCENGLLCVGMADFPLWGGVVCSVPVD